MSIEIRRRGDTTEAHANFIGADREITIDTDKKIVVVHDGKTAGGFPLAREDMNNVSINTLRNAGAMVKIDFVGIVVSAPLSSISGFLLCDGAELSRTNYAALFAKIGTTFGEGDGETTFNLPDYRGYFLRGLGGNSETDFAIAQEDAIRNIKGYFDGNTDDGATYKNGPFYTYSGASTGANGNSGPGVIGFDASRVVPTAEENRPINKAINFFIKY